MASRLLSDLDPRVYAQSIAIFAAWKAAGIVPVVTSTRRDYAEQAALWAKGRDATGKIVDPAAVVTHAPPGMGYHERGLAMDVLAVRDGKVVSDGSDPIYQQMAEIAERTDARLRWGGAWDEPKRDPDHFEWGLEA